MRKIEQQIISAIQNNAVRVDDILKIIEELEQF